MITFALQLFLITILVINGSQASCDDNEYVCDNGSCIDSFLVCDGEKNCVDGSDENKNICAKSHIPCPPFAFRCSYGACIDGSKKCDGKQDCVDNSDENIQMCGTPIVKPLSNNSNCSTGNFQCDSGQCVSEWTICDGETNCRDGSDETDSRCANFRCPQIVGFQCSYGGCIDKNKECNGNKDCRDGSDEENCATKGQAGHTGTSPTLANIPAPVFGSSYKESQYWEEALKGRPFMAGMRDNRNDSRYPQLIPEQRPWISTCYVDQQTLTYIVNETIEMFVKHQNQTGTNSRHPLQHNHQCNPENCGCQQSTIGSKDEPTNMTIENQTATEDEYATYGKYIGSRLREFSEEEQINIKHRIEKLLHFTLKKQKSLKLNGTLNN